MQKKERYVVRQLTLIDNKGKNHILPLVVLELTRLAPTPADGIEIEGTTVAHIDIRAFDRETEKTVYLPSMLILKALPTKSIFY